ncbi:hypothetical protein BDZ97DRAFT_1832551, partial [Flammula alnicola]
VLTGAGPASISFVDLGELIDDLRDAIHTRNPNAFQHLDAPHLTLWKLSPPLSPGETTSSTQKNQDQTRRDRS